MDLVPTKVIKSHIFREIYEDVYDKDDPLYSLEIRVKTAKSWSSFDRRRVYYNVELPKFGKRNQPSVFLDKKGLHVIFKYYRPKEIMERVMSEYVTEEDRKWVETE